MQINTRESSDVLVVDIGGRLDTTTSGYGYDEMVRIARSGSKKIVVNLKELAITPFWSGARILWRIATADQAGRPWRGYALLADEVRA